MSSMSQLSDNVPVRRRGITSKQFGYLGRKLGQVVPDPEKVPTFGITS